ncbi:dipeptidase [candidate division KSB1 bacterium]
MKKANFKGLFSWFTVVFFVAFLVIPLSSNAQLLVDPVEETSEFPESCTSIQVARLASTDGSVMTAHSCDGNYRMWLNIVPSKTFRDGEMDPVYWGTMHTETAWDLRGLTKKGEILPPDQPTYSFMNVCYPCMNEKQLAIGETTIGGRGELYNNEGLFLIEELQRITLQRTTTAREAIKLIGELVKEYGYGDRGECLTFADPKEIWHFEIMGGGPFEVGAVWAAVRIPDDQVGVSANIPRISTLNLDDPDHYMASENVFSLAEEMGWYDPGSGEPFKFWEAYSGRRPYSIREFYILSTLAPSLNLTMDLEELPFSVKPDKKVSPQEMMRYYRETYEGTEYDMTQNLLVPSRSRGRRGETPPQQPTLTKSGAVSPWMSSDLRSLLNALKPNTVQSQRTIAIAGCSYSQIIQCRDWLPAEIGGVAYFSFDNPGQSPRIPIFAGVLSLPKSFEIGAQKRFRMDSAAWAFRRANRLSTVNWGRGGPLLMEAIMDFETRIFDELPVIEQKALEYYNNNTPGKEAPKYREFLTQYTNDFARAAIDKWKELGDTYWYMFGRGF